MKSKINYLVNIFIFLILTNLAYTQEIYRLIDPNTNGGSKSPADGPPFLRFGYNQYYYQANWLYNNHISAVNNAFNSWNNIGAVKFNSTTSPTSLGVIGFWSDFGADLPPLYAPNPGLTSVAFNNYIIDPYNSTVSLNTFFSWYDNGTHDVRGPYWDIDVETILVHEIGHVHGLAHPLTTSYTHDASAPIMAGGENEYFWNHVARTLRMPDVNGTLFIQYNTWVPQQCATIQDAITNSFPGVTIHVAPGVYTITSNINVPSGVTLEITAGTILFFNSGCTLNVNGTLNAVGTSSQVILFGRNGLSGSWGGIVFNQGSSSSIMRYCYVSYASNGIMCNNALPSLSNNFIEYNSTGISIYNVGTPAIELSYNVIRENTYRGIYLSSASPKIYNNTITNNAYNGIYCYNNSRPYLYGNTITGHSGSGLYCTSYSSAYLVPWNAYGYYWGHGENVITNNYGRGIDASYWSNLYLGSSPYGGYNSIYNNNGYELSAMYNCNIMAEINWWGAYPPSSSEFYTYQSTIDYTPALGSNPNSAMQSSVASTESSASGFNKSVSEDPILENAYKLQLEGKFDEAIAAYANFISIKANDSKAAYALVRLEECYTLSSKDGFTNYLSTDVKSLAVNNKELAVVSLELESQYLVREEKYNEALDNFQRIKKEFNLNSYIDKYSIFNTGYIYLKFLNDVDNAAKSFEELATKYPDDDLVAESKFLMSGLNPNMPKNSSSSSANLPLEFGLSQNFPNPFNPRTKIYYQLPITTRVSLMVYDLLGREVATLVNEEKQAGNYEVEFDASGLFSGIYFYQISAGSLVSSKKLVLLK